MISAIRLKNFQSHKDSLLEFVPGVNIIVGSSDSGKTAVLRGLIWVASNRPAGEAFRSHWSGGADSFVEISADGHSIIRRKGAKHNGYLIDNDLELSGGGSAVPEPVTKILNLSEVAVQGQYEMPFLLAESAGEVARRLNKAAELQIIDSSIANAAKAMREVKSEIQQTQIELDTAENQLKDFGFVDDFKKEVMALVESQKKFEAVREAVDVLKHRLEIYRDWDRTSEKYAPTSEMESKVAGLISLQNKISEGWSEVGKLKESIKQLHSEQWNINYADNYIKAEAEIINISTINDMFTIKDEAVDDLKDFVYGLRRFNMQIETLTKGLTDAETDYDAGMPASCPLCGAPVKKNGARKGSGVGK